MILYLATDAWEESKHPRDKDGQFSSTGGGGGSASSKSGSAGLSGWKKTWWQASGVKKTLKTAGYELTKSEDDLPTWIHPSGVKVVVHPPEKEQKNSSNWVAHKPGEKPIPGSGSTSLAKLLGAAVQQAQKQQVVKATQQATPKSESPLAANKQIAESKKFSTLIGEKGYSLEGVSSSDRSAVVYGSTSGGKIQINHGTGEWVAQTPGHMTKKGSGAENLEKLLSGQPAVFKAGEKAPWENTSVEVKTKQEAAKATAQQKLVDSIHQHYADLKKHAPKPSSPQANALGTYGGSGYSTINSALRHGGGGAHIKQAVQHLDEYLANATLPKDMTLYRGVKGEYAKILKSILLDGTKFIDKGYGSTSVSQSFSDNWGSGGLLFKINVKKGTKGAAIGDYSGHHNELEVLLPRNTVYVVKKYDPHSGHVEVDVEHLQ